MDNTTSPTPAPRRFVALPGGRHTPPPTVIACACGRCKEADQ